MEYPQVHDERRIALEPEALTPRESKFFKLMAFLGRRERNARDERQVRAALANRPYHEIEQATLRAMGRIGGGA